MNILVTGASGYIASQIVAELINAGHLITCCVRDTAFAANRFPTATIIPCDFSSDTNSKQWIARLNTIDVVINCVGILYHPSDKYIWGVHYDTPRVLFDACVSVGIKKIIQLSALGVDLSDLPYAKSKKAADEYLLSLPIKSIILRPSLVYGHGSYGGSSLFRGLAGLPWLTPIPGKGMQELQPIHLHDLSKAVVSLVNNPIDQSMILNAVSNNRITLKDVLAKMRSWLGFPKIKFLPVPLCMIRLGAFIGDLIPYSTLNTTSFKMLMQNNISSQEDTNKFQDKIGFIPQDFAKGIYQELSTVQDRWHAKLFFLKPLLRISIAFIWLFTAICSLFLYPHSSSYGLLAQVGITPFWQPILLYTASLIDAGIGISMLCNIQPQKIGLFQIIIILGYSAILTWKLPYLWLDPFAPLAKNIPLLVAIFIFLALESDQ